MTKRHLIGLLGAFAVSALLAPLVPASPARAADNGRWSIFPTTVPGQPARPYFQPLLVPGVPLQDSVTVTNKTSQPLTFNIFAADAFNTADGGFALRRRTDPKQDLAAWTQLPVDSITVGSNRQQVIPFSISPPSNATSGDHPGGIVVEATTGAVSQHGALSVQEVQAVGTRIYARVRGPVQPSLSVTQTKLDVHTGVPGSLGGRVDADVTYTVVNTGNIRLTPQAVVKVSPLLGWSKATKRKTLPELLPHGQATVRERVNGILPLGRLGADVNVGVLGVTAHGHSSQLVIPWLLLAIVAIAVGVWYLRRRRRPQTDEDARPQAPDRPLVPARA